MGLKQKLEALEQETAKARADREEIVGYHLDNEHQSVCLKDAAGYDTGDWRPLPRHEADEFDDECIVCNVLIGHEEPKPVPVQLCRNRDPEPHQAGEFPMTCYPCHVVADS